MKIQNLTQLGSGGGITLTQGAGTQTMMIEPDAVLGNLNLDLDDVRIDEAVIKGSANVVANDLIVTDNDFLSATSFTKTGSTTDYHGGNRFYGPLSVKLEGSAIAYFASTAPDTAFSTLQLTTTASGNYLDMGGANAFVAMGSVYCNQQAGSINLGGSFGNGFTLAGPGVQTLAMEQANVVSVTRITVNKPSGYCRLTGTLEISGNFVFTNGVITTVDSGLVVFKNLSGVSGASDASHVQGPVEKEGNDAFTFPVGRNGIYQPLTITAPSSTAHTFRAEYLDEDSDPDYTHSSRDGSIAYLDRTQYWMFTRTAGTGGVYVTLGWRDVACGIASISDPDICAWSGTQWKNLGNDLEAGTVVTGTARTGKTSFYYGAYTWGNFSGISAHAGPDRVIEVGDTVQIGIMEQPDWDYSWTPSATVEEPDSAITRAYPTSKTEYVLEVTGENSCTAKDTAIVFITEMPEDTARSSLDFVVNNGQIIDTDGAPRPDVGIYSHQASPMVYCGDNRVSFVHAKIDTLAATPDTLARVDINFHETFRNAEPLGMGLNPHHYNYYYAHCPDGVTLTPTYNRVVYPLLYENTDLHIKGNNNWMKFEFVMHPGADPEDILMTFDGADNVQVIQQLGLLVVTSSIGTYVFPKPKALKIDTVSGAVELGWQPDWDLSVTGDTVRFTNIGAYNPAEVLIFTLGEEPFAVGAPPADNLEWSTWLGGSNDDVVFDIVTSPAGNVSVVGSTVSMNFPQNPAATLVAQPNFAFYRDAFAARFDSEAELQWTTYYGGASIPAESFDFGAEDDVALGSVDAGSEEIYLTGYTWCNDFPTQPFGSYYYQPNIGGLRDAFIVMLRADGQRAWGTYFGGNTNDVAHAIQKDGNNNTYICGSVSGKTPTGVPVAVSDNLCGEPSNNGFPLCHANPSSYFDATHNSEFKYDAFIAKFDVNGLKWSTFFGGAADESAWDLAIDPIDNSVYITGYTRSHIVGNNDQEAPCDAPTDIGFPLCYSAMEYFQGDAPMTTSNMECAFIAQFNGSDNQLVWATYFGGRDDCYGSHLAFNSTGDLYLVGIGDTYTAYDLPDTYCGVPTNGGFPLCDPGNGAYFRDNDNVDVDNDVFIAKFSEERELIWSTYYGGSGSEKPFIFFENGSVDIVIDEHDRIYIVGTIQPAGTNSGDIDIYPFTGFYEQVSMNKDAFIASFNKWDQPLWSTYFGGGGSGLAATDLGLTASLFEEKLYIGGTTVSGTFPMRCPNTPNPYCQPQIGGQYDGFIAQFDIDALPIGPNGIEESSFDSRSLFIYPNPTNGNLTLLFDWGVGSEYVDIFVQDMLGRRLDSQRIRVSLNGGTHQLNMNSYVNGTYILQVLIGDQSVVKKFVKQ